MAAAGFWICSHKKTPPKGRGYVTVMKEKVYLRAFQKEKVQRLITGLDELMGFWFLHTIAGIKNESG
jgi:hypothetical protein